MRWGLLAAVACLSGCLSADVTRCADGTVCPAERVCHATGCVLPSQLEACEGRADGDRCTMVEPDDGICSDGACGRAGCGDGVVELPEVCDGPPDADHDECAEHDFQEGEAVTCTGSCTWDYSQCSGICGDHVRNGDEACDDLDLGGATCLDLGYYEPDGLTCNAACQFDAGACVGSCGDGVLEAGLEFCDLDPPAGACSDFGFDMGRLTCLPLCAPSFSACERYGWSPVAVSFGGSARLTGVWANAPDDVWIVGQGSRAHFDGVSWDVEVDGVATLYGVWGSARDDVWAVGDNVIEHWDGTAWTTTAVLGDLRGVFGRASDDVWAVGRGRILHFDGTQWTTHTSPTTATLHDVWAAAPDDVWVVGNTNRAYHYDGSSWTLNPPLQPGGTSIYGVWGLGPDDVYIVGGDGTGFVQRWDGAQWTAIADGLPTGLRAVWASGLGNVLVAGEAGTISRWDGERWTDLAVPTIEAVQSIAGSGGDDAYVVGDNGIVFHHEAIDVIDRSTPVASDHLAVWASAVDDIFLAGVDPGILHYNGATWAPMPSATGSYSDFWGTAADDVWAVGGFVVSHYDGGSWSTETVAESLNDVWGFPPDDLFAVGYAGAILRYQGGSWMPMTSGTTVSLSDVWGSSPSDVFAVGEDGTILHFDGATWAPMPNDHDGYYYAVWGSGPDDVYAVGNYGAVHHYDGVSWKPMASGVSVEEVLQAVFGSSRDDVWIVGGRAILHREGTRWSPISSGPLDSFGAGWAIADHAIVVGGNGLVRDYMRSTGAESVCDDAWDEDGDGLANCADPDCAERCTNGGPCAAAVAITCGDTVDDSTVDARPYLDDYACSRAATGRERAYRLVPAAGGTVTATLTSGVDVDLVVLGAGAGTSCDPSHACLTSSASVVDPEIASFPVTAGTAYYLVVDSQPGALGGYTLDVACN